MNRGRILCVTSNYPRWPGDSTTPFVLHLAQDLQTLGWEVEVLAPHAPGAAVTETIDGVRVERFRYLWPERSQTVCYGGGALVNLRKQRFDMLKVPPVVAAQLWGVARRLGTGRYDLLHSHWALPQGFTGALAARPLGIPHVITCHGEEFFSLRGPFLRPFKRFALRSADLVTANSRATEDAIRSAAPRIEDVHHLPMGIPADLEPRPDTTAAYRDRYRRGDGPLLLFVGRQVEEKGVEDLIRAVGILARNRPDATALIVGEGQDRDAFAKVATELGLADRITLHGWARPQDLPSLFAAADVLVAPSRMGPDGWVEGQGIVPLEAMKLGVPVVATTLGGYEDSIVHERTALAVPQRSPEAIASAVERIVADPVLAARLIEGGRSHARAYERPALAADLSSALEELVRSRRRRVRRR